MEAILTVWGEPEHKSFILSLPRHLDVPEAPTQEELALIFGSEVERDTFDWIFKGQIRVEGWPGNMPDLPSGWIW